ncbi:MAG: SDR family oxidoreductase [Proteobacteria bacterium]|nr:MAG: SDR family oxidoreductase [Pseudomonadota bacterium]
MGKILVTGASGNIGKLTLEKLLARGVAPSELIGLVRDPAKAAGLADLGIELRKGDYLNPSSLDRVFKGVEKVMLVSAQAFTDRNKAHENVIDSAQRAAVKHLVYMPIIRRPGSGFDLPEVTQVDIYTERKIKESGLTFTFVEHPPFLESLPAYIGDAKALERGLRVPEGGGRVSFASREDLAEAHAVVLTEAGHERKTYKLSGPEAISFREMASLLSTALNKEVPLIGVSDAEYLKALIANSLPEFLAKFLLGWMHGMASGEWSDTSGDLERLIRRKPKAASEYLQEAYGRNSAR